MVKLPFLKITKLGTYISILRKNSAQRRILLAKTHEQQTTQYTYQIVKVLETSIFGYTYLNKKNKVW